MNISWAYVTNQTYCRVFNDTNEEEETTLQLALRLRQFIHAEYLLRMNPSRPSSSDVFDDTDDDNRLVNPNLKDIEGKNALHIALDNGAPIELILLLLDK